MCVPQSTTWLLKWKGLQLTTIVHHLTKLTLIVRRIKPQNGLIGYIKQKTLTF